jgi:hypothetical protein
LNFFNPKKKNEAVTTPAPIAAPTNNFVNNPLRSPLTPAAPVNKTSILFSKPNYNLPSFSTQAKFVSPFTPVAKKVYTPPQNSFINAPTKTSTKQNDVTTFFKNTLEPFINKTKVIPFLSRLQIAAGQYSGGVAVDAKGKPLVKPDLGSIGNTSADTVAMILSALETGQMGAGNPLAQTETTGKELSNFILSKIPAESNLLSTTGKEYIMNRLANSARTFAPAIGQGAVVGGASNAILAGQAGGTPQEIGTAGLQGAGFGAGLGVLGKAVLPYAGDILGKLKNKVPTNETVIPENNFNNQSTLLNPKGILKPIENKTPTETLTPPENIAQPALLNPKGILKPIEKVATNDIIPNRNVIIPEESQQLADLTKKFSSADSFDAKVSKAGYGTTSISNVYGYMDNMSEGSLNSKAVKDELLKGGNSYVKVKINPNTLDIQDRATLTVDNNTDISKAIVVGKDGFIIDGRHRALAAIKQNKMIDAYVPAKDFYNYVNENNMNLANERASLGNAQPPVNVPQETAAATPETLNNPLTPPSPIAAPAALETPLKATGNLTPPPEVTPPVKEFKFGTGKSRFANVTVPNSENTTPELTKQLKELKLGYNKVTNIESLKAADARIANNLEDAVSFVNDTTKTSAEKTTTAIQLINKFQKEGNYTRAVDIASSISSQLTKNGQAIQAASIYDRLSPEGILVYAQKQIDKLNNKRWFKGLTKAQKLNPDLAKELADLAKNVQDLTGDAKIEASQILQGALQSLGKSDLFRKIETTQTIAQLLNPKTIIRNVIGNELFYRVERVNKYIATPIDIAHSFLTNSDRTVTFKTGNQGEYWKSFLTGAKAGWNNVNPAGLQTQYDLTAPAFKSKWNPLTYFEKALGWNLRGFDYAAYKRAANQTVGEMGELSAINSGLKGEARKAAVQAFVKKADVNIMEIADQYGKYVTFQDNNILGQSLSSLKKALNLNKSFGFGSLVLKYPKTPAALILRGIDYSPAGFLSSAYKLAKPLMEEGGKINVRDVELSLSRAITGTVGFTGLGYLLADKGVITGQTSTDADLREAQTEAGGGSYKVNISALQRWVKDGFNQDALKAQDNDTLVSYDWAQPIAMSLAFGANMNQSIKQKKSITQDLVSSLGTAAESGLSSIADQPVLQGITKLIQSKSPAAALGNVAQSLPSSFTPTVLNQFRQLNSNVARSTYNPNPLKAGLNIAQNKIPLLANKLPANYGVLGQQKQVYQNGSNNLFNVFLNPSFVTKNNPTPVQKELLRLNATTGSTTQFPRVIPSKLTWTQNGKTYTHVLTETEKPLYQKEVGRLTNNGITSILNRNISDDDKVNLIVKILNQASTIAKGEFLNYLKKKS